MLAQTYGNSRRLQSTSVPTCALCGAAGVIAYSDVDDPQGVVQDKFDIRRCSNPFCEILWIDPCPIEEDIPLAYENYYTHAITNPVPRDSFVRKAHGALLDVLGITREKEQKNRMYLTNTRPAKLLDIGCGNGTRLSLLRELGWETEGQEIDPKAAEVAQSTVGVPVFVGPLGNANYASDSFDAVISNHVFEHVLDPKALLAEAFRILKPGGTLVFTMPNARSRLLQHYGADWFGLDPPRHLRIYTGDALLGLCRTLGIESVEVWTSAAHAEGHANSSFSIAVARARKRGQYRRTIAPRLTNGIYWGLYTWFKTRSDPDSGDELVLKVHKSI